MDRVECKNKVNEEINLIKLCNEKIKNYFNTDELLDYSDFENLISIFPPKLNLGLDSVKVLIDLTKYNKLYNESLKIFDSSKQLVDDHNDKIINKYIKMFHNICGKVENRELDDQQIDSIVRTNHNQMIIAGAGSGKTTTIIGKVKYLLLTGKYNPEDILLLSFTNASASEMKERIKKETNLNLDVYTFHKLGLEIIKKSTNYDVNIYSKGLGAFIKDIIPKLCENNDYFLKLIYFLATARFGVKDDFDFSSEEEYNKYLESNKPVTLKGEEVKSYGELEIANFLYMNGIDYEYERAYEVDTSNSEYMQYYPDFYLKDSGVYLEYFGIDRNKNVAPYFKSKDGKTASELYNESMEWKRRLHEDNFTVMIETYYYEKKEGTLLDNLKEKLKKEGIKLNPVDNKKLWEEINKKNNGLLDGIIVLFETIINLMKSNDYSITDLKNKIENNDQNKTIIYLIKPIIDEYNDYLRKNKLIDFNDMINLSRRFVEENKYIHHYKYVIVDEYQDMSKARYNLLYSMRIQNDFKLFCVGDDWQSIYRFAGSDLNLTTDFENYWGKTSIGYISKTYRFSNTLSHIAGNFVMKNPKQLRKAVIGIDSPIYPLSVIRAYNPNSLISFFEEKLDDLEKNATVYLIGRYKFDIDMLKDNKDFEIKFDIPTSTTIVTYVKRKDLKISFLTAHKSKGLQADYVFIINNKNKGMGFPSKIVDLAIIDSLLEKADNFECAEERRLFYVALTRSKKKTILLVLDKNESTFVKEIVENYSEEIKKEKFECPECGGRLIKKNGQYGEFYGCSNYPNCKHVRKI